MADLSNLMGSLRSFADRGDHEALILVRTFDALRAMQKRLATAKFTSTGDRSPLSGLDDASLDGVPSEGDVVLLKDQADPVLNGLYRASAGAWTRLKDDAGADVMAPGLIITVTHGEGKGDTQWEQVSDGTSVGVDPIVIKRTGENQDISPSSIRIAIPEFSVRTVVTGNGDWSTPPFLLGSDDGTGAIYEQRSNAQSFTVDTDPQLFEVTDVASGFFIDLATTEPLPACTPSGGGAGKTLTGDFGGPLVVDGVTVTNGLVVLVKDQVNPVDNGLYQCTTEGAGEQQFVLTRVGDWDTTVVAHQTADITGGTQHANTSWWVIGTFSYDGPLVIDDVSDLEVGDLILVVSGGSGSSNAKRRGIYKMTQQGVAGVSGAGGLPYRLARYSSFDTSAEVSRGASITVVEGTAHANSTWLYPPGNYFIGSSAPVIVAWNPDDRTVIGLLDVTIKNLFVENLNGAPPGGGGGAQVISGMLVFDTDGSGDPQTYKGNLISVVKPASAGWSGGDGDGGMMLPAGQIKNLRVRCPNLDGGDNTNISWQAKVYVNGSVTSLVKNGSTSALQSNTTDTVTVEDGDFMQLFFTVTLTDGPTNPQSDVECGVSVDFTPGEPF